MMDIILVTTIIILIPIALISSKLSYSRGLQKGWDEGWEDAGGNSIPHDERNY